MRYLLITLAAFLLFALPAFAYDPPDEGIQDTVDICVDIQCYMEFDIIDELICFEIWYEECEGTGYDAEEIYYYIQCNGDWYVLGMFEGYPAGQGEYDQDWDEYNMFLYVNGVLMTSDWSTDYIDEGTIGTYEGYWPIEMYVNWIEKGDYNGLLTLELWDP
jgi:hypothetical protein